MKVLLCNNHESQLNQIAKYIENYAMIEDNSVEVVMKTTNPYDALSFIDVNEVDCFFLDIDFVSDINGIDLAKKIRSKNSLASIIFIASCSDKHQLTFTHHIEALDFIIQDEIQGWKMNILKALAKAYKKYAAIGVKTENRYYQLKMGEYIKNIPLHEILFFQTANTPHKIKIHTIQGSIEFYGTLKQIEQKHQCFFRCHQSFIVNTDNITQMSSRSREVKLCNGEAIPVSFRRLKVLSEKIFYQVS